MHLIQKQTKCLFSCDLLFKTYNRMASQCAVIQEQIENLVGFLQPFLVLANSHMVDYFSKSLYNNSLPEELRTEIAKIGYENTLHRIFNSSLNSETLELQEYINKTTSLRLYNLTDVCLSKSYLNTKLIDLGCRDISSLKLEVFVTPKKSHEVEVLSQVAAALNHINNATHLIDLGDGKGYLSSMLALHHQIPVLGVDASTVNTDGAVKRVRMLEKVWKGIIKNPKRSVPAQSTRADFVASNNLYKQITHFVTEDTDFEQLISSVFLENSSRLGVVGLHTCGNLGSTSVKVFSNNRNIKTLCNVSCCYHLLTEEFEDEFTNSSSDARFGFPLSTFLKESNFKLGRTARMLSSQSVDRILHKKELPNKIVFYRSILEMLLQKYGSCIQKKQIGKFRKKFETFADYAENALKSMDAKIHISEEELNELFDEYRHYEDQLNVFFLLRCMLAPVIESLILLDRLLFLHENQFKSAFLVHLFDPVISPRCYGLIAFKEE